MRPEPNRQEVAAFLEGSQYDLLVRVNDDSWRIGLQRLFWFLVFSAVRG
jgi:hypothetical protein